MVKASLDRSGTGRLGRTKPPACSSWLNSFEQMVTAGEQTHRTPTDAGICHPQRRWPGMVRPVVTAAGQRSCCTDALHHLLSQLRSLNPELLCGQEPHFSPKAHTERLGSLPAAAVAGLCSGVTHAAPWPGLQQHGGAAWPKFAWSSLVMERVPGDPGDVL